MSASCWWVIFAKLGEHEKFMRYHIIPYEIVWGHVIIFHISLSYIKLGLNYIWSYYIIWYQILQYHIYRITISNCTTLYHTNNTSLYDIILKYMLICHIPSYSIHFISIFVHQTGHEVDTASGLRNAMFLANKRLSKRANKNGEELMYVQYLTFFRMKHLNNFYPQDPCMVYICLTLTRIHWVVQLAMYIIRVLPKNCFRIMKVKKGHLAKYLGADYFPSVTRFRQLPAFCFEYNLEN